MVFFRVAYHIYWPKHPNTQAYRKFTNINHADFSQDILKELEENPPGTALQEMIQCYNNILSSALDTHAPVKHCTSVWTSQRYPGSMTPLPKQFVSLQKTGKNMVQRQN